MKIILYLGITLLAIACGYSASHHPKSGNTPKAIASGQDDHGSKGTIVDESPNDLQLVPPEGSAMSFLDSKALTEVYSRVFPKSSYGYAHCAINKPIDSKACDDIFAPDEAIMMGSFALYNPSLKRGAQNVNRVTSISLNYVRSLRSALSRECDSLVARELKALRTDQGADNLLIKAETPTAASIEGFARRLLGLEAVAEIAVDIDAAGYAADFPKALELMPDRAKAQQSAYLDLCIAVAMDPQIFLY